ncbi:PAS domain-containing protein [Acidisphaera sp. L21]|uniref:PAS domain-containing protein n=1 Tax=Acidisphaera sp. L21 TaxID=1641851 RepID=UPI00131D4371|nr:PAS domain-containing protein [Acidisphaera sp. L21]
MTEFRPLIGGFDPFSAAVAATHMPMVITDPRQPDNPVVYANNAFCALTGFAREEILGQNCRFLQGPSSDAASVARIREAIKQSRPIEIDVRNHHKDGSIFWNRLLLAPVLDQFGTLIYFFANQLDVTVELDRLAFLEDQNRRLEEGVAERTRELVEANTRLIEEAREREKTEAALRQSHKMEAVGQLTGGIAHDFNNMLQAIGSSLELMGRRIERRDIAGAMAFVDGARKTVARAGVLTNRLLTFARQQVLLAQPIVLEELVQDMGDLVRRTVGPNVIVALEMDDGDWTVMCDKNQLENALLNLAINARDAMPEGGVLTISTREVSLPAHDITERDEASAGDYVEIAVTDTGTGMDAATRARVFEPFFTTKPAGQGTGLGLSQLYGFVRQSNGIVRLLSEPGHGTTISLYLPRSTSGVPGELPDASQVVGRRGNETIVLVEDEEGIRTMAAEQLRDLGYIVLEAPNGPAGLQVLRVAPQVDLLITDVGLPGGLNGRQVADTARRQRPGLPVLFITGYAGHALGEQLADGMHMIDKPFAFDVLSERVRAIFEAL